MLKYIHMDAEKQAVKSQIAKWLFDHHLELQRVEGERISVAELARRLDLSQPRLSRLMAENVNDFPGGEITITLANYFNDPTIYDIMGWPQPKCFE
ncbi:MAG: hypothetical protein DWQ07_15495 [Chloroflexi bacterium]|nr:MAG: hypothetical protein DWQ07_15495 [Chloroflexota bacterium]MBL1197261.1 hypothetical protein [Chloroflexota bacterium]